MKKVWRPVALTAGMLSLALLGACREAYVLHRTLHQPGQGAELSPRSPYVKAHLKDGGVLLFSQWTVDESRLSGQAQRFNAARQPVGAGFQSLPLDSAVLLETNTLERFAGKATLQVMAGFYLVGDALCASIPKACFGSCPTFYTLDGAQPQLQAEGFSASISPALEATDVDALCLPHGLGSSFTLEVRNEALETHAIRHAELLLLPRAEGEEVLQDVQGRYWAGRNLQAPQAVQGLDATALAALSVKDGSEWSEGADDKDLGRRQTLELRFPAPESEALGLAVCGRQSLLTTYLFYQALAWMGTRAGDCLAALERGDVNWNGGIGDLAQVRVSVWNGARWQEAGTFHEVGPLALDEHVVPLPPGLCPTAPLRVRLDFTQGAWRWDRLALARLRPAGQPLRVQPSAVTRGGAPAPEALAALTDPSQLLMTEPGDAYRLHYSIPVGHEGDAAMLESRGWYLEWMREDWLKEENPRRLARLLRSPGRELKALAPAYKAVEAEMDGIFWSSKYAR